MGAIPVVGYGQAAQIKAVTADLNGKARRWALIGRLFFCLMGLNLKSSVIAAAYGIAYVHLICTQVM